MPPCGTGQTLAAVQNGDSAKLEDVLVGEVWLASGQSNMLFRLNQTTTAKEDIAASGDDQLRLLNNVPQAHTNNAPYSGKDFDAVTTDNFYKGQWAASSPATSGPMTAVGYYFGKKLREGLGIPVGIIHSSLGGSEIAAWIPRQVINANNSFRTLRGNHWLDSPPYLRLGEGTGQEKHLSASEPGLSGPSLQAGVPLRIRHRMDNGPPHHGRHLVSGRIRCGDH